MKYLLSLGLVIIVGSLVGCTRVVAPPVVAKPVAQPTAQPAPVIGGVKTTTVKAVAR